MARHWLAYWQSNEIEEAIGRQELPYASSNQLQRVRKGDTVWIVHVDPGDGLTTIGPIQVAEVTRSREAIKKRLGSVKRRGRWHVFGPRGTVTVPRRVRLQGLVGRLRFHSSSRRRLSPVSGPKLAQQLQTMRCLTEPAADLMEAVWHRGAESAHRQFARSAAAVAAGDKVVVTKARREQAQLRRLLLGGRDHGECLVCGRTLPGELLVAAHIIPRAKCTIVQRSDPENVVLMCALGCDALFEGGYLEVSRGVVRGRKGTFLPAVDMAAAPLVGRRVARPGSKRERYFNLSAKLR